MTILPKKKTTKDKNEAENVDHSSKPIHPHSHPHHHQPTSENRHEKVARGRTSPSRWIPTGTREDKISNHDPGGGYDPHESASGHNKRRHRSSPHRNHNRKHRGGHAASSTAHTPIHTPGQAVSVSPEYEETGYNSGDEYVAPDRPENIEELEEWFERTLKEQKGFVIKKMGEDGACLFRAVADQVFGDEEMHSIVRKNSIDYMAKNADYYSHYVTEDFTTYLNRKRMANCHGNHLEMQAMCEIYNRPIEVYQYSLDPINTFHSTYKTDNEPIRISYHRNVHYNSVNDPYKATIGVGLGLPTAKFQPGLAEKHLVRDATRQSEDMFMEKAMLQDKLRETDWEVTQETIEEQVARESYLQWLKDNEQRVRKDPRKTASATCSSSSEYATQFENLGSPAEGRLGRSPRSKTSAPNSAQNSPQRVDMADDQKSASGSPVQQPLPIQETGPLGPPSMDQAQGAVGGFDFETHSTMNQYPNSIYADLSSWDEEDILAQVMARSQQEYLDSLRKNAAPAPPNTLPQDDASSSSYSQNRGLS